MGGSDRTSPSRISHPVRNVSLRLNAASTRMRAVPRGTALALDGDNLIGPLRTTASNQVASERALSLFFGIIPPEIHVIRVLLLAGIPTYSSAPRLSRSNFSKQFACPPL